MELLATTEPGAGGEIQLTDALVSLLDREDMYALVIDPSDGYDTGTVPSWIAANVAQAMKESQDAAYLNGDRRARSSHRYHVDMRNGCLV